MVWGIVIAVLLVLLILFLGFAISDIFRQEIPVLLFLIAVMLSGLIAGARSGLVATLFSLLVIMYLFIPPVYSLSINSTTNVLRLGLFVLEGVFLSFLIEFLHIARRRAVQKAEILMDRDRQLREAHKKTRDILNSITDAFFTLGENWRFTYINKQTEALLQSKRNDLLNKNIWKTFPDMVNTDFYTKCKIAKKSKKSTHFELWYESLKSWFSVRVYPLKEGLSVYISDETEHKLAEQALRETENKMMLLTKSPFIGIAFAEDEGIIVYGNDAYLHIIGRNQEEIEHRQINWRDITPPEWFPADENASLEARETGACIPYEKEYIRTDGIRVPVLVALITYGENRKNAVVFVMDITKRKELEYQKEEFLAEVSHELKSPVASIKAYEQYLKKHFQKLADKPAVDILSKMEGQIDKITRFIDDLLDAARLDSGQVKFIKEDFYIDQLVKDLVEAVQNTTKRRINVYGLSGQLIEADKARIEQVLSNLLVNAVKYSPNSDKVEVSIKNENRSAVICVKDFGIGIPKSQQSLIFQRMRRVQSEHHHDIEGLGLGLYVSSEIIKRLNGRIWFTSRPGRGSTFCFSLPFKKSG